MFNYQKIIAFSVVLLVLGIYRLIVLKSHNKPKMPVLLFILFAALEISTPIFEYYGMATTAHKIDVAAAVVLAMALIRVVVFFVVDYFIRYKNEVQIPTITRDFILAILYIIAAMIVLKQKTNVNLGSLLTTSAILTAVIGFAMQDTLGNLFSGLALQLESPYEIGDWISFEGITGKVVGITWKSTKILTRAEELIFVPNNTIAKSTLTNLSRPTPRHWASIEVGAAYDESPVKVKQALLEIMQSHPKVLLNPAPAVRIFKYDNFSVNYRASFATEDVANEEITKLEILNSVWFRFKRDNIKIPYPVQENIILNKCVSADVAVINNEHLNNKEILNLISSVDLFSTISDSTKNELVKNITIKQFAAGENIVVQGADAGPMYLIKEGCVSILISHSGSAPAEIKRLSAGEFFGEMSVLTGAVRSATARAFTDCICYEIDREDIKVIFESDPQAMEKISLILAGRNLELNQHKEQTEAELTACREQQKQLLRKIKSFFGI